MIKSAAIVRMVGAECSISGTWPCSPALPPEFFDVVSGPPNVIAGMDGPQCRSYCHGLGSCQLARGRELIQGFVADETSIHACQRPGSLSYSGSSLAG